MRPQLSSKPIKVTCSRLRCQPIVPTGFPPVLHMSESSLLRKHRASHPAAEALLRAIERVFRLEKPCAGIKNRAFSARAEAEAGNLVKDRLEVLAKNAKTLRGSLSPNENPVAGVNCRGFMLCLIRCRTSDESCGQIALLATHCSRRILLYQTDRARRKGGVTVLVPTRRSGGILPPGAPGSRPAFGR